MIMPAPASAACRAASIAVAASRPTPARISACPPAGPGAVAGATARGRGQDGPVLAGLLPPGRLLLPGRRRDQCGLVAQVVQDPDQQRVAATQVQGAVKLAIGQAPLRLVGGAGRPV